jgi:fructosamine-3-kinase
MDWQSIYKQIEIATDQPFKAQTTAQISGGDINSAYRLQNTDKSYFVKLNRSDLLPMFEAELAGLHEIANTKTVQVPSAIVCGKTKLHSFLVLEYIEFRQPTKLSDRLLGQQMAFLHHLDQPCFGWHRDNTIGSTEQSNSKNNTWLSFWREHRLGFQLKLAEKNGYGGRLQTSGEQLLIKMDGFFANYQPKPSLLHGDLWSGNAAVDIKGNPVAFDPACYYGDREADLAMTELFGGFSQDFYAAYQAVYPLDPDYTTRKAFYNLYHILNHLNLFGGGYLKQSQNIIAMLLAELS